MRHPGISPVRALLRRVRTGQSTVEYMLVISVIVIGLIAAVTFLDPKLAEGLEGMQGDVQGWVSDGVVE